MESIIALLNTCRNTIQEVRLHDHRSRLVDVPTLQPLQTLPQLRTLSLNAVNFENESSVFALLQRLPSLKNLVLQQTNQFVVPEQAAPLLKNLRHLTISGHGSLPSHENPVATPALFQLLAKCGSKLKSLELDDDQSGISFPTLHGLTDLHFLKSFYVNSIKPSFP